MRLCLHRIICYVVASLGALLCLTFATPSKAEPAFDGIIALSGFQSYITQVLSNSAKNGGYAVAGRGGFRIGQWGGFAELQYVGWTGYSRDQKDTQMSYNFGLGFEYLYFQNRLRTALSAGMAILATEAVPDPPGRVGAYVEVLPASYVLSPWKHLNLILTPLSLYIGMPSLKGIPLVIIQYRMSVAVEFSL